jgi:hypothetical protein
MADGWLHRSPCCRWVQEWLGDEEVRKDPPLAGTGHGGEHSPRAAAQLSAFAPLPDLEWSLDDQIKRNLAAQQGTVTITAPACARVSASASAPAPPAVSPASAVAAGDGGAQGGGAGGTSLGGPSSPAPRAAAEASTSAPDAAAAAAASQVAGRAASNFFRELKRTPSDLAEAAALEIVCKQCGEQVAHAVAEEHAAHCYAHDTPGQDGESASLPDSPTATTPIPTPTSTPTTTTPPKRKLSLRVAAAALFRRKSSDKGDAAAMMAAAANAMATSSPSSPSSPSPPPSPPQPTAAEGCSAAHETARDQLAQLRSRIASTQQAQQRQPPPRLGEAEEAVETASQHPSAAAGTWGQGGAASSPASASAPSLDAAAPHGLCLRCGHPLLQGAAFCTYCAAPVRQAGSALGACDTVTEEEPE